MLLRNAPRNAGYVEAPRRMWQSRFRPKVGKKSLGRRTVSFAPCPVLDATVFRRSWRRLTAILEWQVIV